MNYDMTYWEISITIGAELFSSIGEFNYVQGYRNWYYLQYFHSNDSYVELTYDNPTSSYIVSRSSLKIFRTNLTAILVRELYLVAGL